MSLSNIKVNYFMSVSFPVTRCYNTFAIGALNRLL